MFRYLPFARKETGEMMLQMLSTEERKATR
jgi:hypothetical protein